MISYNEALRIILQQGDEYNLGHERIEVSDIAGRIAAMDVRAAVDNQPFDNSAMDGFAVKVTALQGSSADHPVALAVEEHIAAGELKRFSAPADGKCHEIMTGAPVPPGCDAVVPVEKTTRDQAGRVLFHGVPAVGENIRYAGSDFKKGDLIVSNGDILSVGHILALATLGIGHVDVVRRARVGLISTGQEIIDSFETPLQYGQIYNSTKPYLKGVIKVAGMELVSCDSVQDDRDHLKKTLALMIDRGVDIILSTGAVSAGTHDFVPSVLEDMGAKIFFHKVAIRPGKPVLFAQFPGGGPFYCGLPGNPAASAAGMQFFVRPLVRAMQDLPAVAPLYAMMKGLYRKGDLPLRFFMQGWQSIDAQGQCLIEIPQKQQSFMVSPFAESNVWAVIPEDVSVLKDGDLVAYYQ